MAGRPMDDPYGTLAACLGDPELKQRLLQFLASRGGSSKVHFTKPKFRVGIPYRLVKAYFRALPDDFMLAGDLVALAHTAAANLNVQENTRNPRRPPQGSNHTGGEFECALCKTSYRTYGDLQQHLGSSAHRIKSSVSLFRQQDALHSDQGGITVTVQPAVTGIAVNQPVSTTIYATNHNTYAVTLHRFSLLRRTQGVSVEDERGFQHDEVRNDSVFDRLATKTFTITFTPKAVGVLLDVLVLEFDGFSIMRELTADCEPQLGPGLPSIAPSAPFQKRAAKRFVRPQQTYEEGEPPPRSRHMWKNAPGSTRVPLWLEDMVADGKMGELEVMLNEPTPTMATFVNKLQRMLWVEELQHEVDIRQYDMEGVTLGATPGGRNLALQVPGLAENRPSVMRGDALYVRNAAGGTQEYQGYVHEVRREEVFLRFSSNFHRTFIPNMRFHVRFSISRSTFVFMQAGLQKACMNAIHPATLLGAAGLPFGQPLGRAMPLFVQPIWTTVSPINEEQKTAVRSILSGAHAPLPYLIFGPPGTGKTMTMTEAAVQINRMNPVSRLLLTAPSNSAADQLALRALEKGVPASNILRVCAYSRPPEDMDRRLQDMSNWNDSECAFLLDESLLVRILSRRVVVTTCLMAAKLHALGVPPGHFTHVFIDEAGHAEEPLSLAAVAGLLTNEDSAKLILAGDPKQLGPVILSPLAQRMGLATSAMERLTNVQPYARAYPNDYNSTFITKLINNYRSHPALLKLPNKLFYEGELQAMAHPDHTHSLLGFNKLPNRDFPIIFHAVVGRDEREASSPSWFNQMEAKLILEYVMALQDMRSNRPNVGDIGVISPYRKQVQKIRMLLTAKYGHSIKVGSVEEFQGQERRAILISTVRSSVEHLEFDAKHRLGFLSNPKRFNVALTRAKALLVVVGNPDVLCKDPNWMEFLVYCVRNRACAGSAMPAEVVEAASRPEEPAPGPPGQGQGQAQGNGHHAAVDPLDEIAQRLFGLTLTNRAAAAAAAAPAAPPGLESAGDGFMYSAPLQIEGGEMPRME